MAAITYKGSVYTTREGETLLDAFLRQGVVVPFSCRNGICHVCMHRRISGVLPSESQKGLSPTLRAQGFFLLCKCTPFVDMEIVPAKDESIEETMPASGLDVGRAFSPVNVRADYPDPLQPPVSESVPESRGLAPDPEMWNALGEGALLHDILRDFYTRVYADERLSPFFEGVTMQRSIEKQYLFLRQIFTGEKVYFGDRPRNAHHWMVVSDELFDYRKAIMTSCLQRAGLPEPLVERWLALEEHFRPDIVKTDPWKRVIDGVELPVDGFGEETLEIGTLCDGCEAEISSGTRVRYHLRLGKTYGPCCMENIPPQ